MCLPHCSLNLILFFFGFVLDDFLVTFPPSISIEIMYFKTIVSFHPDTGDHIQQGTFLCWILILISTFTLFSHNTGVLEHFNFIYHFSNYSQYHLFSMYLNPSKISSLLIRQCWWFAQCIGFQTEMGVGTGCTKAFEEAPEHRRFNGKQCPGRLFPGRVLCVTDLPEVHLLLRHGVGMDLFPRSPLTVTPLKLHRTKEHSLTVRT